MSRRDKLIYQDKISKIDIAAVLDAARGGEPLGLDGYRILEHGWLNKYFQKREQNQKHSVKIRDFLWNVEYVDFLKYAGVSCSL